LIDACKDILNANDIVILQPINGSEVETILLHLSGEWISSFTKIVSKTDTNPQDQGSAITYSRRYGLQSMLFMSAEDDDGEKATIHAPIKSNELVREPITNNGLEVFCATCKGKMTMKTGVNKDGKKWTGYFCDNKDHAPRWV
jgi:hypothetical protein